MPFIPESFYPIITQNETSMPFYVISIGNYDQYHMVRNYGFAEYQLLYTVEGSGAAIIDGKEYALEKGSIYFTPPNVPHNYYPTSKHWITYWITFNGTALKKFFNFPQGIWQTNNKLDFVKHYKNIFHLRHSPDWLNWSGAYLYALLCECTYLAPQTSDNLYLKEKLSPAIEYIALNYTKVIETAELASLCSITAEHFCRIFRKHTGVRPTTYINFFRIQRAKELILREPKLISKEIAAAVGFSDASYFTKVFREIEGKTPNEFKKIYIHM